MAAEDTPLGRAAELRRQAEEKARERTALAARHLEALLPEDTRHMLHELRVHQIELELQNEELRRTAVELDVLRARYFDLYDVAPVGYCTIDEKGRILQANLTAATLLGVARGALTNQLLTRSIATEDQDEFYLHRKKLVETGESQSFEPRLIRSDGTRFWAHLVISLAPQTDGSHAMRLVLSDISEHRRIAAESARLVLQLQHGHRLDAVVRLAGGVAHDLDAMLAGVLQHAEQALRQPELAEPLRAELERIRDAAQRPALLSRLLVAFAGQQTVDPQLLDLNEAIAALVEPLRRAVGDGIRLTLRPEPSLWPVRFDRAQLEQMLTQLCLRSRDASTGNGTIAIELANCVIRPQDCAGQPDAVPGDHVRITVRDDGRVVDQETLAHLFEPYFTSGSTAAGAGMRLPAVHGSVRQNRGFMSVTSEAGKGTSFAIHLPRHAGTPGK